MCGVDPHTPGSAPCTVRVVTQGTPATRFDLLRPTRQPMPSAPPLSVVFTPFARIVVGLDSQKSDETPNKPLNPEGSNRSRLVAAPVLAPYWSSGTSSRCLPPSSYRWRVKMIPAFAVVVASIPSDNLTPNGSCPRLTHAPNIRWNLASWRFGSPNPWCFVAPTAHNVPSALQREIPNSGCPKRTASLSCITRRFRFG
jgi:hypothetical protein